MNNKKRFITMLICGALASSSLVSATASANNITHNSSIEAINSTNDTAPIGLVSIIHNVFNIPRYTQTGNTCWLECVRSVVNYKLGTSYSDADIRTIMNYSPAITVGSTGGLSPEKTVKLLNRIFVRNHSTLRASLTDSTLTYDEVKEYIDDDKPIIMYSLRSTSSSVAHDVVISGYATCANYNLSSHNYGDYTGLTLMNPQDGTEAFYYDSNTSDSNFYYTNSNNQTYYWNKSIVLQEE